MKTEIENAEKEKYWSYLPRFETMPVGWRFDNTWGSPIYGFVTICSEKSVLNGGKKGLLKSDFLKLKEKEIENVKI